MKRIFMGAALMAIVTTGCQNDEQLTSAAGGNYSVTIRMENESRVYVDGKISKWNSDDQLFVSSGDGSTRGTLSLSGMSEDGVSATFSGSVSGNPADLNYAVTPAPVNGKIDFTTRTATQSDPIFFGTFGTDKSSLNLTAQTAIVRLNLNNATEGTLTVTGTGIAGTATVSASGLSFTTSNTMTITGVQAATAQSIDIPVLVPASGSVTLTVAFNDAVCEDAITVNVVAGKITASNVPVLNYDAGAKTLTVLEAYEPDTEDTTKVTPDENGVYNISTAAELAWLASQHTLTSNNNITESVTINLTSSIDMGGAELGAIIAQRDNALTFNGNGNAIYNAKFVSGEGDNTTGMASMFYAYPNSTLTVSDLKLVNVTVVSDDNDSGYAAAVIGYCEGTATLTNVDVENATVTGAKSSGMLVGHLSGSLTATDCDVRGSITLTDYENGGHYAGEYIGTVAGDATLSNCTASVNIGGNLKADNNGVVYGRIVGDISLNVNGAVATQKALNEAIADGASNIILTAGKFNADLYNVASRDELTIVGQGAETELVFNNLQVRLSPFKKLTVSDCTIGRMPGKNWGHMVFGSSEQAGGIYTVSNCVFDGVGSQGIYINQTVAATFNIESCTFNGNFGPEGAVTIQNNENVNITVNVTDCTFRDIPESSHEIFIHYAYNGWTLNADNVTPYWKSK